MTDVRTLLHDLAAEAPRGHGEDTADRVVDLHRAQDRRRLRWAGTAAAIALVVAVVPTVLGPVRSADEAASAVAQTGATSLFDVPTRGSLAGDQDVVDGALAASWGDGIPFRDAGDILDPAPGDRHVAFVGEVPGGQVWALVVGRTGPQLAYAWFVGVPGDDAGAWRLATLPERTFAGLPAALVDTAGDHGPLLVVGMPDEDVQLVPFEEGAAAPGVTSSAVQDGIAAADVLTPEGDALPGYRVSGGTRSSPSVFRPLQFDSSDQGSFADVVTRVLVAVSAPGSGPRVEECLVGSGWLTRAADGGLSWPYLATDDDVAAFEVATAACEAQVAAGD